MNSNRIGVWETVAIVEGIVLLGIVILVTLAIASPQVLGIKTTARPVPGYNDPLRLALDNDFSDEMLEQLIQKHPEWMTHRSLYEASWGTSLLADSALLRRTNYVKVLIANGADVEKAVRDRASHPEAVALLRQVQQEVQKKSRSGAP